MLQTHENNKKENREEVIGAGELQRYMKIAATRVMNLPPVFHADDLNAFYIKNETGDGRIQKIFLYAEDRREFCGLVATTLRELQRSYGLAYMDMDFSME